MEHSTKIKLFEILSKYNNDYFNSLYNNTIKIDKNNSKLISLNKKPIKNLNKLKPFEFWDYIDKPKYVCAPMVDHSELSFRLITRKYGVKLAYTPMIHSVVFTTNDKYQKQWMNDILYSSEIEAGATFMQFCGHDPEILLKAAKLVEGKVEGIDLNLGCPQGIAKRGNYGAYLLDNTDLVLKIVGYLSNNLTDSALTVKIRLFPELNNTFELVNKLIDRGIKVLAVHGRTKEEKGQFVKECNFNAIKDVRNVAKDVPFISNGGIETFDEVQKCFDYTGCDAVMSSEGLLEYPALFYNYKQDINKNDICITDCDIEIIKNKLSNDYKQSKEELSITTSLPKLNAINENTNIYTSNDDVDLSEDIEKIELNKINKQSITYTKVLNIDNIAIEFIEISRILKNDLDSVRSHLFKFMYRALQDNPELNQKLAKTTSYEGFYKFVDNVRKSRIQMTNERKLGWYRRYRLIDRQGESIVKDTTNKKKPKLNNVLENKGVFDKHSNDNVEDILGMFDN